MSDLCPDLLDHLTGLGLMLSYEFVKLSGGQIDIESNVGKGTTFHTKFKSGT
ncbi:MAG: ATP-binding protein [Bacteroidota bacterium]